MIAEKGELLGLAGELVVVARCPGVDVLAAVASGLGGSLDHAWLLQVLISRCRPDSSARSLPRERSERTADQPARRKTGLSGGFLGAAEGTGRGLPAWTAKRP